MQPHHWFFFFIFLFRALCAQSHDWPYDDYYTESKTYIHAIANYELHPLWHERWENNLFRRNMLRLNFASISSTELLSDARLALNQELAPGFWFRYATTYYATHHRQEQDKHLSLGFEKSIYKTLSIYAYGNPHFEKEEMDFHYGISLTNKDRSNYLRLAYVDVAPFWDDKNNINSITTKQPWHVTWETNVQWGRVRFFSRGRYDDGLERHYMIEPESPASYYQQKKINDMLFKVYYYRNKKSFIELSYSSYDFQHARRFNDPYFDYTYRNQIDMYKLGYITPIKERYRLRFGSHAVIQRAASKNYREHSYHRQEIIPYIFMEMFAGPGIVEAGYMGSQYNWEHLSKEQVESPSKHDYIDKVKLAYTFNFKERAFLQFSVSHVTTIWGFGGGNVQFWMEF